MATFTAGLVFADSEVRFPDYENLECLSGDGQVVITHDTFRSEIVARNLSTGTETRTPYASSTLGCLGTTYDGSTVFLDDLRRWNVPHNSLEPLFGQAMKARNGVRSVSNEGDVLVFTSPESDSLFSRVSGSYLYEPAGAGLTQLAPSAACAAISVSANGRFVVFVREVAGGSVIVRLDRHGGVESDVAVEEVYSGTNCVSRLAISDDGQRLAVGIAHSDGSQDGPKSAVVHFDGAGAIAPLQRGYLAQVSADGSHVLLYHPGFGVGGWFDKPGSNELLDVRYGWRKRLNASGYRGVIAMSNDARVLLDTSYDNRGVRFHQPFEEGVRSPVTFEAAPIPGVVLAAHFDFGGEDVSYHDTTPTNVASDPTYRAFDGVDVEAHADGGVPHNVGYVQAGEWLSYTVHADRAQLVDIWFEVSSALDGGVFHLELDGENVTGPLEIPNTGDWRSYISVSGGTVYVSQGTHDLKLVADVNASRWPVVGNFRSISFLGHGAARRAFLGQPHTTNAFIEAEHYDVGGQGVAFYELTPEAGSSTSGFREDGGPQIEMSNVANNGFNLGSIQSGEWLSYQLEIPEDGLYDLKFRVASTLDNGAFRFQVGGTDVTGPVDVPNTGGWQSWQTVYVPRVWLNRHTDGFGFLEGRWVAQRNADQWPYVTNLDWIRIDDAQSTEQLPFAPDGARSGSRWIEAEHYDLGGEGVAYSDTTAANISQNATYRLADGVDVENASLAYGGHNVGNFQAGEWMEYSVDINSSGRWAVELRVASALTGGAIDLEVDGEVVSPELTVPNTGGWQTWESIRSESFMLDKGRHVLRIAAHRNGARWPYAGNIDRFRFVWLGD